MKVTVENKKGLNKDLKVFIDKKTITTYMDDKYEEIKKTIVLKGFRPGKVPKEVLKRQFGKAVYGEVIDKVLKETSSFLLFKFIKQEISIDSSNFVVQFFLTFFITSSITSAFLSLDDSSNFLYLFDRFDFINLLPLCPLI